MPQRALAERGNVPAGSPHPMQRAKPARHTAPSPPSSWPAAARAVVLLELPLELLLELCARMGSDDLARLAQSCRAARAVAYHPALWRACVLRLPRTPLAALAGLRSRLAQSTALELRPCSCTTAAHGSRCIAEACPRLDPALDHLASCGTLSAAAALEPIVRMAPRLEQLSLCGMVHLSFAGFVGILRACPELRVLNARGCLRLAQLTPAEAAASEVRTPHAQLRELDLSRTWATSAGVGAVLRHAPQLARLKLNFCERLDCAGFGQRLEEEDAVGSLCAAHAAASGCLERVELVGATSVRFPPGCLQRLKCAGVQVVEDDSVVDSFLGAPRSRGVDALYALLAAYHSY